MSTVNKCDHCGKTDYPDKNGIGLHIRIYGNGMPVQIYLCPKCRDELGSPKDDPRGRTTPVEDLFTILKEIAWEAIDERFSEGP